MRFYTRKLDVVQPSTAQSASGTSANTLNSSACRSLEVLINITAAAAATFDFIIETSLDGTTWMAQHTFSGVTAISTIAKTLNFQDHQLFTQARVRWVRTGGSMTFEISAAKFE